MLFFSYQERSYHGASSSTVSQFSPFQSTPQISAAQFNQIIDIIHSGDFSTQSSASHAAAMTTTISNVHPTDNS